MESKTKLVLTRKSEFVNRARGFRVLIDGQQAGIIRNGGAEEFHLAPGQHQVICKIDWCSSREYSIDIREGETVYLQVGSAMKYYWHLAIPLLIFLAINLYLSYTRQPKPIVFTYVLFASAAVVIGYLVYYTVINRKGYLLLEKDTTTLFGK